MRGTKAKKLRKLANLTATSENQLLRNVTEKQFRNGNQIVSVDMVTVYWDPNSSNGIYRKLKRSN